MKFMVCRKDGIEGTIRSSELWPTIVEADADTPVDQVVFLAMESKWPNYRPLNKSYYVVPMDEAALVTFKPRQDYDVIVTEVR